VKLDVAVVEIWQSSNCDGTSCSSGRTEQLRLSSMEKAHGCDDSLPAVPQRTMIMRARYLGLSENVDTA